MIAGQMDTLLRALQHHTARVAINSSSMRGAGSPGVVAAARAFLGTLKLHPFGTASESAFRSHLDATTDELMGALPQAGQSWGRARKGLNIFLRDCLYNAYLRDAHGLLSAEHLLEVPLDSITGTRLARSSKGQLPRWKTVRALTPETSSKYQAAAALVAAEKGIARVHLDAMWWGERDVAEQAGQAED